MTPPPGITLADPELALLRRCLLFVEGQAQAVRRPHDAEEVAVHVEMAMSGARFLLEWPEERRGLH